MTVELVRPTADLRADWEEVVAEFGDIHIDGSGLTPPPNRESFDELLARAARIADTTIAPDAGRVHNDLYWIVDDGEMVGFISFRHELNDWLRRVGGHIGYSVRPTRRRQGYASAALRLALDRARELGLDRVMITCDDDNVGSYRTIEGAGGVLTDTVDAAEHGHPRLRHYWIEL